MLKFVRKKFADNFFFLWQTRQKEMSCLQEYKMEETMYQIRTDLALETQEKMQEDHVELKGVRFLEENSART